MQISVKNREKNRELTKIELINLGGGGQPKVYVFFKGGSQKCTFVDKGEGGVKNAQKCVYVFYGCPLRVIRLDFGASNRTLVRATAT